MLDDLRFAVRSLLARPGPALAAVACLGVGIGINVALLGLLDALLFQAPAGVARADELVRVRVGGEPGPLGRGAGPTTTYPQYERVAREQTDWLDGLAAYGGGGGTLTEVGEPTTLSTLVVTGNYFDVLGVIPRIGRFFTAEEGARDAGVPVAVLSLGFWERAFGRDPAVLGRRLRVNGLPLTVIGVAPAGFVGVDLGDPDLWIPMGLAELPEMGWGYGAGSYWLQMFGRLRPGLSLEAAAAITTRPPADPYATADQEPLPVHVLALRTMFFGDQRGQNPVPAWALALSLAVLLLASTTVANLTLARAVQRRRDLAVRLALGGSPARIVREQMMESALVALAAGLAATLLACASLGLFSRLPIPPVQGVVTPRSAAFGLLLGLLTPLVFGLAPALWAARRDLAEVLRDAGSGSASAARLHHRFISAQVAVAFTLLLVGALFLQSFAGVRSIDTGIDTARLLEVRVERTSRDPAALDREQLDRALERIRSLPGVEAATMSGVVPFYMSTTSAFEIADGRPDVEQPRSEYTAIVGPDYLRTLGIELLAGRPIGDGDGAASAPVAVVSESLARRYWPSTSPLGSCVIPRRLVRGAFAGACGEVVGIVADAAYRDPLTVEPTPTLYLSAAQVPATAAGMSILVRATGDPADLAEDVRRELRALDPGLPSLRVEPLEARLRPARIQWEVAASLFTALGSLAGLLAAIGLYVVVAFIVTLGTRELGIRVAIGAQRAHLVRLVLARGARMCAAGLVLGVAASLAVARLFGSQFYGLTYADAPTYAAVAAIMLTITLLASLPPALRVLRLDPATSLRAD